MRLSVLAKVSAVFLLSVAVLAACNAGGAANYSIKESRDYEASMFRQNCAICHGPEAEGRTLADGRVIPNLRVGPHKYATDEQIYQHISEGGNGMVPFRGQLSDREIKMLVKFVQEKLRK
ncbi:MAG: cytochrome c [Acidobacteriota bacterium]|nr:MAG: cytochrome c [Acidobacteriota bacterium]